MHSATLHTTRVSARPIPHACPGRPRQEPWDPSSFNFYRASPLEFVLSYTPSFRVERNEAAAFAGKAGVIPADIDAAAGESKAGTLGALRGVVDKIGLGAPAAAASDGGSPVGCAEVSTATPPEDAVLVNIRPVGLVSLLLTPGCVRSEKCIRCC